MKVLVRSGILLPLALSIWILAGCGDDNPTIQEPPDGSNKVVLTLEHFVDPSPGHYVLWAVGNSNTTLIARFTLEDDSPVALDGSALSVSDQVSSLPDGTVLAISLESDTTSAAPGAHVLVAGAMSGGAATLRMSHSGALGVDLTGAAGALFLDTPTTTDPHDCENGIWWTDGSGGATLEIPTLPSAWRYEGWVIDREEGEVYSTGRFAGPTGADSDGAGATASTETAPYDFPGQDFVNAAPPVPVIQVDNGIFGSAITLEPEPDNSDDPFPLKILSRDVAATTMVFGITNLPTLTSGAYYEAWAAFADDSLVSIGSFHWSGGAPRDRVTGEQIAGIPANCNLVDADYILLSVEDEAAGDPRASGSFVAAGAIVEESAYLSAHDARSLGDGFDGGSAFYTLTTPSTATTADESYGIWFFQVSEEGETTAAYDLPPAPSGWHYESWVKQGGNQADPLPISLGTFTDINGPDSDGAGPYAGDDTLEALPPYPGQDFVVGANARWIANGNHEAFITLEPDDDFAPTTTFVTLFRDPLIVNVGPDTTQAMTGFLLQLPEGPVEYEASNLYEMESFGNRLPSATVSAGR